MKTSRRKIFSSMSWAKCLVHLILPLSSLLLVTELKQGIKIQEELWRKETRTMFDWLLKRVWKLFPKIHCLLFSNPPPPPPPPFQFILTSLPNYTKQYESDFEFTTWRSVHHIKSNTLKKILNTIFHTRIFIWKISWIHFWVYANICLFSYIRKRKRRYPSYRKDLHSNQVSSIENMLLVK